MKKYPPLFFLVIAWMLGSCTSSPEKQAKDLLQKSIAAHEKGNSWSNISTIKFRKWTRLLIEDGSIESEADQWNEFRIKPYFEGKIYWTKDSLAHVSTWDGSKMTYLMGGNEVYNADFLAQKKKDLDAAFYAFAQPWKLLDEGASLSLEAQKTLENGKLVNVILVDYGPNSDMWWYYFDPVTHLMIGNEVQLKDHRSLIYNGTFDESSGMLLHGDRESYRVNEQGKKLYVRAEYRYSDYELSFE
jgi:hypothetical protein